MNRWLMEEEQKGLPNTWPNNVSLLCAVVLILAPVEWKKRTAGGLSVI